MRIGNCGHADIHNRLTVPDGALYTHAIVRKEPFVADTNQTSEHPARSFYRYLRPYACRLGLGMVFLLLSTAGFAAVPLLIGLAVDTFKDGSGMGPLTKCLCMMFGITCCAGLARFFSRKIIIYVSRDIEYDIRNELFDHLMRMDTGFFSEWRTGDIMSRCADDLAHVRLFVGPGIMRPADTFIAVPIVLVMMLRMSPALTGLMMLPLPVVTAIVYFLGRIVHVRSRRCQEQRATLTDRARENLTGIRVVKSYARENYEIERFETECAENLRRNVSQAKVDALFWPLLAFVTGASMTILIYFGGRAMIDGRITTGDFFAFTFYMMRLYMPMAAMGWVVNLYQRATAAMIRINEIFLAKPEIDDRFADHDAVWTTGDIEFRDVTVQYPGTDRPALRDINVRVPAGSTAAVVGPTGCGKTSFVTLIPRLIDPTRGQVRVGGKDVKETPLHVLRSNIGCVPQETFLFSDTLRENIAFGSPDAALGDVVRAAEVSQLRDTLTDLSDGLDTMLGERGVNLSGGQKQRTALARAIVIDPAVLILDDAMSSVDTHTEEAILSNIRELRKDKTTLLISHRVSTVQHADMIIVIDGGRIVEQGTHTELVDMDGLYADMYRLQQIEQELDEV